MFHTVPSPETITDDNEPDSKFALTQPRRSEALSEQPENDINQCTLTSIPESPIPAISQLKKAQFLKESHLHYKRPKRSLHPEVHFIWNWLEKDERETKLPQYFEEPVQEEEIRLQSKVHSQRSHLMEAQKEETV